MKIFEISYNFSDKKTDDYIIINDKNKIFIIINLEKDHLIIDEIRQDIRKEKVNIKYIMDIK